MGKTIVIKGVDKTAYEKLKSKAAREGLTIGQAASSAFTEWSLQDTILVRRIRDPDEMKKAREIMDESRSKLRAQEDWSSERVIRESRDERNRKLRSHRSLRKFSSRI